MKYPHFPMPVFALVLVSLFLPDMAMAAEPASQKKTKQEAEDTITLSGVVVDEQDKPVPGVKVLIEWKYLEQKRDETKTDKQGRFTLRTSKKNVRGQIIQAITDSGQKLAQRRILRRNIDQDHAEHELRLQLQPARRVELHVVDATGKPIANAKTGIIGGYRDQGTNTTDGQGHVVYHVPQDVKIQYVFAVSDGHGADYKAYVLPRGQSGDKITKPPAFPDHPVQLKLEGAQPLKVQLKETDGTPIAGVKVYPWLLDKPDQTQDLNLSYFYRLVEQTTDAEGTVVFAWIPDWQKSPLTIWPRDQEHVHQRGNYDPKIGDGTLTIKLQKLVPLAGRVTLPDGSPAKRISISASGEGYQFDSFRSTAQTDEEGRYVIKAAPNMVYLLVVNNLVVVNGKKWASKPHTSFALLPGKPIENLDFQLRPATRLFGRVTLGSQHEPVKGQRINVYQYGQAANKIQGVQLPNPENKNKWVQPITVQSTSTDENGKFELSVGDGKYDIRGPRQNPVQKFEIAGESEKEFNFHAARPEKGILEGTIVTGDPPQPVPDAEITGIYRASLAGIDMKSKTDESGQFKVERELHRTVIYARSKDKKRAGVVEIGPDDKTVTVLLRPLGSASGKLVDAKTKEPMQEREISYSVKVHEGPSNNSPFRSSFGGKTRTDQAGRFEIVNLVLGQKYDINLVIRPKDQPDRISWRTVETVKAEDSQPLDLGVVEVSPPPTPYQPPTLEERITAAFNVKGTPLERFNRSKQDAKITMQHLLILFGEPKGDAVQQLMKLRYEDQDVREALNSFVVLAIDTSADKRTAAEELAKTLGENLDGVHADFFLVITDEQGKRLANVDASLLSTDGKISKEKFLELLKAHTVPTLDAQELLATALKKAKKENKRIIIQETATWCGPCRLLSRFLVKERNLWERDYIWIKIDHRWTGSSEMMKTMRAGAQGGIPWWAILDKDGKVLVTSNDEEGTNIGFPGEQSGRVHFRTMLEKTAIRLTPMEINTLVESLKQEE